MIISINYKKDNRDNIYEIDTDRIDQTNPDNTNLLTFLLRAVKLDQPVIDRHKVIESHLRNNPRDVVIGAAHIDCCVEVHSDEARENL